MTTESDTRLIARLTAERDQALQALQRAERERDQLRAEKAALYVSTLDLVRRTLQARQDSRYAVIYDVLRDLDDPKPRTVEIIARLDRLAAGPVGVPAEQPKIVPSVIDPKQVAAFENMFPPVAEPLVADPPATTCKHGKTYRHPIWNGPFGPHVSQVVEWCPGGLAADPQED